MNYETASKRFDTNKHLETLRDLDWLEMISKNNSECKIAEKISIPQSNQYRRDIEHLQQEYISNLKGLGYLLGQGYKPAGVNEETFQSFKPLIEVLVNKKQLKSEILLQFD